MRQCYHQECDDMAKVTNEKMNFLGKLADTLASTVEYASPVVSGAGNITYSTDTLAPTVEYTSPVVSGAENITYSTYTFYMKLE